MKIVNSPTAGWRTLRKLSVAAACVGLLTVSAPVVAGASLAPAMSKPTVVSFKATPSHLSAAGGTVTLTAKVSGATTCTFSGHGTVTVSCSSGSAKVKDKIAANGSTKSKTIHLYLVVKGGGHRAEEVRQGHRSWAAGHPPDDGRSDYNDRRELIHLVCWRLHLHFPGTGLQRFHLGRVQRHYAGSAVPQRPDRWLRRHFGPADRPGEHNDVRRGERGAGGIESPD